MRKIILITLISMLWACSQTARPRQALESSALTVKATFYHVAFESEYSTSDRDGAFLDPSGKVLYRGSREFLHKATTEGTAHLNDGRILNNAGKKRWLEVSSRFGVGVSCPLIPLRSAAVDKKRIPLNSILYIKETVGVPLPDGTLHDGIWYALDTGGDIKGNRIDLFTGERKGSMAILEKHGIQSMDPVTVTVTGKTSSCPSP